MKDTPHEVAVQSMVYNRHQVDRCLKFAFDYARKRNKDKKLALVGKTNVLTYVYDLWNRAFNEMGDRDYKDIKRDYYHVDATCLYMINNPEWFDVIVTGNMFGDIITDLAAITQGGLGISAGGNLNPEGVSMFEPIGGTAPMHTGKNTINPLAAILSAQMMIEQFGETKAAAAIESAVQKTVLKMKSMAAGEMGMTTTQVGDSVADMVAQG